MANRKFLRTAGVILLAVGAVAALGALVVRDQMSRHRRDLFSPHPLRRLAALGYLAGHEATVDAVRLLRDFIAWEPRPLIRRRAVQILERMEQRLREGAVAPGEAIG
jgi:hypothetical protein